MCNPPTSRALRTLVSLLAVPWAALAAASPPPVKDAPMPSPPKAEEVTLFGGMYTVKQIA